VDKKSLRRRERNLPQPHPYQGGGKFVEVGLLLEENSRVMVITIFRDRNYFIQAIYQM
jgi:hypothetical protein